MKRGRKPFTLTDFQRGLLAKLAAEGTSLKEIARVFGWSGPDPARRALVLSDLHAAWKANRKPRNLSWPKGVAHTHGETIARMSAEGKTLKEIGDAVGVSRERIRQLINKHGCAPVRWEVKHKVRDQKERARRTAALTKWYASPKGQLYLEAIPHLSSLGILCAVEVHKSGTSNVHYAIKVTTSDGYRVHLGISKCADQMNPLGGQRYWHNNLDGNASPVHVVSVRDGRRVIYLIPAGERFSMFLPLFPNRQGYEHSHAKQPAAAWVNESVQSVWLASDEYATYKAKRDQNDRSMYRGWPRKRDRDHAPQTL